MTNENGGIDHQFIFREIEFEDEKFHAASFIAKYRRVTSLESLRDQLRLYCDALKQQLYGIINRDYKDFITIATKVPPDQIDFCILEIVVGAPKSSRHLSVMISLIVTNSINSLY